jgi:arginine repressor
MSLKSYFIKDHKYKTQADLKDMTAEEIVSLNPSDVSSYIETETGGIPLTGVKKRALYNLLARKKVEKKAGINPKAREKIINDFLQREGLKSDTQVEKMLVDTDYNIMTDRLQTKLMENRLRKLQDKKEAPYTDEEKMYLRMQKLIGGKTRRYYRRKTANRKVYKKKTYKRK